MILVNSFIYSTKIHRASLLGQTLNEAQVQQMQRERLCWAQGASTHQRRGDPPARGQARNQKGHVVEAKGQELPRKTRPSSTERSKKIRRSSWVKFRPWEAIADPGENSFSVERWASKG